MYKTPRFTIPIKHECSQKCCGYGHFKTTLAINTWETYNAFGSYERYTPNAECMVYKIIKGKIMIAINFVIFIICLYTRNKLQILRQRNR